MARGVSEVGRRPFVWGAMAVFALLAASTLHDQRFGVFGDDAIYLSTARSLAQGRGYRVAFLPGEPLAAKYPPVYPLMLAAASWLLPELPAGLIYFKLLTLLLAVPGMLFTAYWLREVMPRLFDGEDARGLERGILAVTSVNAGLVAVSAEVMSEAMFFSLLMASLWLLERAGNRRSQAAALWWALGLAVVATYTRAVGAPLLLVVGAVTLARCGPRRAALVAGLAALAMLPWWWWTRGYVAARQPSVDLVPYLTSYDYHGHAVREYLTQLGGSLGRYLQAVMRAGVKGIAAALAPFPNRAGADDAFSAIDPSGIALTGLVLLGLWPLARRAPASGALLVLYAGAVVSWPWLNKTRFFVVVTPLLAVCMTMGLLRLLGRLRRTRRVVAYASLLALGGSNLADHLSHGFMQGSMADAIAHDGTTPRHGALVQAMDWVRQSTPRDAVLLVNFSAPLFWLYTGRKVLPYRSALASPGTALRDSLDDSSALEVRSSLRGFVRRARLTVGEVSLYDIRVCRHGCSRQLHANSSAVFSEAGLAGAEIVIRRLPDDSAASVGP